MRANLLVLTLAAAGCGRTEPSWPSEEPTPVPTELPERHSRFSGLWMVDQPFHGGYEQNFYALGTDGRLEMVDSFGAPVTQINEVTGVVAPSNSSSLRCEFGASWRSVNGTSLFIDGRCTDGVPREIELSFTSAPAQNAAPSGAEVSLTSVGGEPGWIHPGFEWRFKKCPPGPASVPAGACEG